MMHRYLFYSSLAHAFFLSFFLINFLSVKREKNKIYYIDFISATPSVSTPQDETSKDALQSEKDKVSSEKKEIIAKKTKPILKTDYEPTDDFSDSLRPSMATIESKILKDASNKNSFSQGPKSPSSSVNTDSDFPYPYYITEVREILWDHWQKIMPINSNLKCTVRFKIRHNGSFYDTKIEKSSGNRMFDQAAISAVESAKSFPPLPENFFEDYLTVHVEFKNRGD